MNSSENEQICEPASNVDQNFRPSPLFDQHVAAPVGVQSRRLFALPLVLRGRTCTRTGLTDVHEGVGFPSDGTTRLRSKSNPCSRSIGVGGQPGITRSTGITFETAPTHA